MHPHCDEGYNLKRSKDMEREEKLKIEENRGITVFDFDGTLTDKDTFGGFAKYSRGRCRYWLALIAESPRLIGWKLGFVSNSRAKEMLFRRLYRGMEASRFRELGRKYADEIEKIWRRDTRSLVRAARDRGDELVVVTASIYDWVYPWAERKGFDRVIATRAEIGPDNRLSGRFSTPNCHGDEKVRRFYALYPNRDEYALTVYGDSDGDAPLLHEADKGMKV